MIRDYDEILATLCEVEVCLSPHKTTIASPSIGAHRFSAEEVNREPGSATFQSFSSSPGGEMRKSNVFGIKSILDDDTTNRAGDTLAFSDQKFPYLL